MNISYDPKFNIAYIRFKARRGKVTTLPVSEEANIDIGADGKVYGIELLNANKQLNVSQKKLAITSQSTGKTVSLLLTPGR